MANKNMEFKMPKFIGNLSQTIWRQAAFFAFLAALLIILIIGAFEYWLTGNATNGATTYMGQTSIVISEDVKNSQSKIAESKTETSFENISSANPFLSK
ncbi:MAG: hypothetical protein ABIE68_00220 [bacterium]